MLLEQDGFVQDQMRDAIGSWRGERAVLQAERERLVGQAQAQAKATKVDAEEEADRILGYLDQVEETFERGPVVARNRVMRQYVSLIELMPGDFFKDLAIYTVLMPLPSRSIGLA